MQTAGLPSVSVIIAIYNNFHWLKLILEALRPQCFHDMQIIIADDGSDSETVSRIRDFIKSYPEMRILHSWLPDEGWRKNRSLNHAVAQASGDLLIFLDGDCIPHPDFINDHRRLATPGVVTAGRRMDLCKKTTSRFDQAASLPSGYISQARADCIMEILRFHGGFDALRHSIRFPFLSGKPLLAKPGGILGCNFSIFKADLLKVNGFDERYIHPGTGEDSDLDVRLLNAGITHRKSTYYALVLHRHHNRLEMNWPENHELLQKAITEKLTFISSGIYKDDAATPTTTSADQSTVS